MFYNFGKEIKQAVKYTRVSTNQQDERGSKDIQDFKIREFASNNNFNIAASFTDTDHGDNPDRPGINALKDYLTLNRDVKYVICLFADRFTRDFKEAIYNGYFLNDLGVTLVTVAEGIIKLDGTFESIPSIIRFIGAQEEKAKIVKKTKEALYNYALNTNRFLGGSLLPWFKIEKGYINGEKRKIIVKNEETWDFYRKVFMDIIRYRNLKKVSEVNGLSYNTMKEWIRKPEILGYRTYGKKGKMDKTYKKGRRKNYQISEKKVLPAIVSDEEFEIVKSLYNNSYSILTVRTYPYLFTQISYCSCGGKFSGNRVVKKNKNSKKNYYFYRCEKCKKVINAKKVEEKLIHYLINDKNLKMLNDYEFRIADMMDLIVEKEQRKRIFQEKESQIIDLITEGLTSFDVAKNKLKVIKEKISIIEKEIAEIEKEIELEKKKEITSDIIDDFIFLLKNYDLETLEDMKEILNLIIRKIIIYSAENFEVYY